MRAVAGHPADRSDGSEAQGLAAGITAARATTLPWDAASDGSMIAPATVCSPGEEDAMRPIMNITMCALVATAVAAPALAPTPAYAASADYYLRLGDVKGDSAARTGPRQHIEILS